MSQDEDEGSDTEAPAGEWRGTRWIPRGIPFRQGEDPRRKVSAVIVSADPNFRAYQREKKEELGKKILQFGSRPTRDLVRISKDEEATAMDRMVAALWFSASSPKGSPLDRKLLFVTHGLPTESGRYDHTSSDGSMTPTVIQAVFTGMTDEEKVRILKAAITSKEKERQKRLAEEQAKGDPGDDADDDGGDLPA